MTQRRQHKQMNPRENYVRKQAKNLVDDTIDCIKDECVKNSITEIELNIYTEYGIVTRQIKV